MQGVPTGPLETHTKGAASDAGGQILLESNYAVCNNAVEGASWGRTDIAAGRRMTVSLMCSIWYNRVSKHGWVAVYPLYCPVRSAIKYGS